MSLNLEPTLRAESNDGVEPVRIKIGEKGRVVIPAPFRDALGMKPGDFVDLALVDNELRVSTFRSRLERARKRVQRDTTPGKSLVDDLLEMRREEVRREEQRHQHLKNGITS
jgi:AbrB family looped-hinge helix DNA binding protein